MCHSPSPNVTMSAAPAVNTVRPALEARASTGKPRSPDVDLGIHYTSAEDSAGQPLGTIAVVISPSGRKRHLWRFGDGPRERVDLGGARLFRPA